MPIIGKIDVTKIDKTKLFKGQKGTYLDVVLIETPNDQYGNSHMIVQGVSQEDRAKGIKGAIIGNAKVKMGNATPLDTRGSNNTPPLSPQSEDDLPF